LSEATFQRYPEKRLQLAAIDWLKRVRGYTEVYSDEEATGARVDSIGLLAGQLVLIEVKTNVTPPLVDHRPDRAHSIESKIAGILRPLFHRERSAAAGIANRTWDRQRPPLVCVLADSFSTHGLASLSELFRRRSTEWYFDYAAWRWTGTDIDPVDEGVVPRPAAGFQYETILVPTLLGRTVRAKPKTVAELLADAAEHQCDALLAHLVSSARDAGFLVERGRTSVGFSIRLPDGSKRVKVMGAYLDGSSAAGLNVGWWNEALGLDIARLPGLPLQSKAGFLNSNRLLRSIAEVDRMLAEVLVAVRRSPLSGAAGDP